MTREEFSEMLVEARASAEMKQRDMVFAIKMMPSDISIMENAKQNYSIIKALKYLAALNYYIRISNDYSDATIESQDDALKWFKLLKSDVSTMLLAPRLGVSQSIVNKILNGKGAITIDMLIRIANFYNCNITIEKYE